MTAAVHDRMPVILDPDAFELWLDPGTKDVAAAVCVSQGEVDWSFHGSGLAANQMAAVSAHRLQNLIRCLRGWGQYYKRAHVPKFFQVSTAGRSEESGGGCAADPNYGLSVTVKGSIPHDSAPNPLAMFW